jgi:hypothetical protein
MTVHSTGTGNGIVIYSDKGSAIYGESYRPEQVGGPPSGIASAYFYQLDTSSGVIGRAAGSGTGVYGWADTGWSGQFYGGQGVKVVTGDVAITTSAKGVVIKESNGTNCRRITVNASGVISASAAFACP